MFALKSACKIAKRHRQRRFISDSDVAAFSLRLESVFQENLAFDAVARLRQQSSSKAMLLLAGDQLTGKSTLGLNLAKTLNASYWSVGDAFREIAKQRQMSAGEFSEWLLNNKTARVDVDLDFKTCEMIAGGEFPAAAGVIEGRQPAFMAMYVRELLNKHEMVSVFLKCRIRERALRFLLREFGDEVREIGERELPQEEELGISGDDSIGVYGKLIAKLPLPDIERVAASFVDNQNRDVSDTLRYQQLYGINYRDESAYDIVIDTSGKTATENLKQCTDALKAYETLPQHFKVLL